MIANCYRYGKFLETFDWFDPGNIWIDKEILKLLMALQTDSVIEIKMKSKFVKLKLITMLYQKWTKL